MKKLLGIKMYISIIIIVIIIIIIIIIIIMLLIYREQALWHSLCRKAIHSTGPQYAD